MALSGAACADQAATPTTAAQVAESTTASPIEVVASTSSASTIPSTTVGGTPTTAPKDGAPEWSYVAGFGLGSDRIDVLDRSGALVHSIETTSASAFRNPIQTVVPSRVIADRLTSDSELLVLDAVAGEIHQLA